MAGNCFSSAAGVGGGQCWGQQHRVVVLNALFLAVVLYWNATRCLMSCESRSSPLLKVAEKQVKKKRAILITSQDSGSTWLRSVLDGLDGVSFQGERMISQSYKSYDEWLQTQWEPYKKTIESALEFGDTEPDENILVGFKLMYDQIPQHLHRDFAKWLNDNGIYVIHLRRRAAILQIASHRQKVHAKSTGELKGDHVTNKKAVVEYPKIQYDRTDDYERIRRLENNQRNFADYLQIHAPMAPQIELWYELLDGPHQHNWFNALFAFLGIDQKLTANDVGSDLVKVGKRMCDERIEGLKGPEYSNLDGLDSQRMCAMLYWESEIDSVGTASSNSFYPPAQNKCLLTPALSVQCIKNSTNIP